MKNMLLLLMLQLLDIVLEAYSESQSNTLKCLTQMKKLKKMLPSKSNKFTSFFRIVQSAIDDLNMDKTTEQYKFQCISETGKLYVSENF